MGILSSPGWQNCVLGKNVDSVGVIAHLG